MKVVEGLAVILAVFALVILAVHMGGNLPGRHRGRRKW